jgi:cysteinyl-tRNA synthetase
LFQFQEQVEIPSDIQALAEQRRQAKVAKDFALADILRQQLTDA